MHRAAVARMHAAHHLHQRRLAGAVGSHEYGDFACAQLEIDVAQHPNGAERLLQTRNAEHGFHAANSSLEPDATALHRQLSTRLTIASLVSSVSLKRGEPAYQDRIRNHAQ